MTLQRILIRLPNWLGDVLMARPLLHAVRAAYPGAEIRAVAKPGLLALLEHERTFDRGEPWPVRGADEDPRSFRAEKENWTAALAAWRPDVVLVLPFSFSSAWFAFTLRAPMRIGYGHELRSPLLTHVLRRRPVGDVHLSREYLALAGPIGVAPVPLPVLDATPAAREAAAALRARHAPGAASFVVMAPRSAYGPAREWPRDRFVALAREQVAAGHAVLISGTAGEQETCDAVAKQAGPGVVSLAGLTDLPTLTGLVADAALAVCNDSGLAHLAGAVGTPTVTLYGSTSSSWTTALGPRVRIVQHPPVCSPCFRRTCRIGYICLTALSVTEVGDAARDIMNGAHEPAGAERSPSAEAERST